jgi:formylglycine-generating enzyme required for sulfatase activity
LLEGLNMGRLFPASVAVLTLGGLFLASGPPAASASRAQEAGAPPKLITNSIGMKLALIPAGKFLMGSPATEDERAANEVQHEVTISRPFYMGVHEVSQREFGRVAVGKPGRSPRAYFNEARGGGPDHPMDSVDWIHAAEYCRKLSDLPEEKRAGRRYRLPTEAEWEYACRGGTTTAFHFGAALSSKQANFNGAFPYGDAEKGPYLRKTAKVGSYAPNAWGLYDMHGNVAEWCADWYDPAYYRDSPKLDPKGPPQGVLSTGYKDPETAGQGHYFVVIRGGCWLDEARGCRAAYRFRAMPADPYRLIGFRVACDLAAPAP